MPGSKRSLSFRGGLLAAPERIPERSAVFAKKARKPVAAVSVVGQNERDFGGKRGLFRPKGRFHGKHVFGDISFSDVGRTQHKIADRPRIRHEKMKPKSEKELPLRRREARFSGPNRQLCRFPTGRLGGGDRSRIDRKPHGQKAQSVHQKTEHLPVDTPGPCAFDGIENGRSDPETGEGSPSGRPGENSDPSRWIVPLAPVESVMIPESVIAMRPVPLRNRTQSGAASW